MGSQSGFRVNLLMNIPESQNKGDVAALLEANPAMSLTTPEPSTLNPKP